MSYAIHYGPERKRPKLKPLKSGNNALAILVLGAVVAGAALWPQGVQALRLALCPWLDQNLVSAWSNMVAQVREGTSVVQAVTAFCREVIFNAGNLV